MKEHIEMQMNRLYFFRRFISAVLFLAVCSLSWAYDFEVDGIYYNVNSNATSVTVTYKTTSYNSYSGSIVIPSVVNFGDTDFKVTCIGNYAFKGCSVLTKITIPNSVTSIEKESFNGCRTLRAVTIPNSVTSIGNYAFAGCSALTSVTIGNGVTSIGEYAFSGCSALTSVTIGNGVTSIGKYVFYNCSGLTSVTIPNSVTKIEADAFTGCSALTKAEFASVESLCMISFGNSAANPLYCAKHLYINGQKVTNLAIPNSVTSIGNYAFYGCSGLTSVTIPNSVTSIGWGAFSSCTGLTSVTIPNSVISIGGGAFQECTSLTSVTIPNSVTNIRDGVFMDCGSLTSVTIPNSVTIIGQEAFKGCTGLTSVTIPNSVTRIDNSAYYGCKAMSSVTIGSGVTSIGEKAFYGCSGLTSVSITNLAAWCEISFDKYNADLNIWSDNGNTGANPLYYALHLFLNGQELTDLVIPNDVTYISHRAFINCTGLKSLTIPNSVTSIGDDSFYGCSSLTSVTLNSNSITSKSYTTQTSSHDGVNFGTIFGSQVQTYILGDDIKSIGDNAFTGCSGLKKAEFASIESLCKIKFGNDDSNPLYYAHHLYINGQEVTDVVIPNSVTSIGNYAFRGCSGLTSITIPNSVTSIGSYAFDGCSGLTSVTIGNGVTSIGKYVFYNCSGLTSVTCQTEKVPTTGSYCFYGVPQSTATLYVPATSVNAYKSASQWKVFGSILSINIPITGISLNQTSATLTSKGQTLQLTATVTPSNATNKSVTWSSSNTSVATVSSTGLVTAVSSGTATITATTADGSNKTATCTVTVNISVPATSIALSQSSATLTSKGQTLQLSATVTPSNATDKSVTWSSSNTSVATVSSTGLVTAVSSGTATITATTADGSNKTATCTVTVNISVPATGISLSQTSATLTSKGQTLQLSATVTPSNATNKSVTWTSSDTSIATVSSTGLVTAVSSGIVTITATTADGSNKTATCTVTVDMPVSATGISLSQTSATLTSKGQTLQLSATIVPSDATNKNVTWTSSNTAVATVDTNGLVTAVANGSATITVRTADGSNKTATCTVAVNIAVPATGISLSQTSATLTSKGQTMQLSAIVTPSNATNKSVTWNSSNTAVATVSSTGLVTAVAGGTATITATTADGSNKTATCTVTVNIPVLVTGITLNQTSATLTNKGQTLQLSATVTPSNATNKSVTWTSSNTSVATVSSTGLVTAVSSGTATITATTADGSNKTATCTVTVDMPVSATGISLSQTSATLTSKGQTMQLSAIVTPSNATNKSVTWSSSNTSVATVSSTGLVTAVMNGSATITVKTADGSNKTVTCLVMVNTSNGIVIDGIFYILDSSTKEATVTYTGVDGSHVSSYAGHINIPSTVTYNNVRYSVTSIGEYAFNECVKLASVTIPETISNISSNAFNGCTGLTTVTINANEIVSKDYDPPTVNGGKNIGTLFGSQVEKFIIGNNVTSIGANAFRGCNLTSVTIGNNVTTIGSSAFRECTNLISVTIPNSVTDINIYAFLGCWALKSVTIGKSVTTMSGYTFYECNSLTSITCEALNVPTVTGSNCFKDVPSSAILYVPASSIDAYRSTAPWSDFGTIESHYSKTPVHNVEELQSGQVYTAETRRAAWYVPEEGTQLLTTVYPTSVENNQYDSGQQFAFIKWNDNIYIYCVGEQKILNGITSNTPNNGVLVTEDCQPVTIKETGDTDYPFFFTFGDNYNINVGGGNQITIDQWTTFDDGNKVALRPVHGVMIDEDEMWRIIAYIEGNSVLENHYSQAPVQNVGELINDRQVYTAETRRAAWYVPAGNTQLETTEVPAFEYKNSSNRSQQFAFIKHKGQYYIYCVGEGKILNGKTSNSPSRGVLVTEDCQPVTIRGTGDSYYPLFFSYGENYNVNIGGGNQITIDRWSTIDDGNKVALRPVQGVVIDDKEMRRIIEYIDGYITGDSNGNGEVEIGDVTSVLTLMATPEATGYNNKAADANGNGEIEIGDVTTILTIMAGN